MTKLKHEVFYLPKWKKRATHVCNYKLKLQKHVPFDHFHIYPIGKSLATLTLSVTKQQFNHLSHFLCLLNY